MKNKYRRPRPATSNNTSSSFVANAEREALARKGATSNVSKTGGVLKEVANHANPLQTAKSPTNIGTGVVKVPEGSPEASTVRITIDSTGLAEAKDIVLGVPDIYIIKGNASFTENPTGAIYSGDKKQNNYPLWLKDVAQNTYIFHMAQISVSAGSYSDGTNTITVTEAEAREQLHQPWLYVKGNVQGNYSTDTINIDDARNPYQEDKNTLIYTFEDGENRLDALSAFVLKNFRPGIVMNIVLRVTAVLNGRL